MRWVMQERDLHSSSVLLFLLQRILGTGKAVLVVCAMSVVCVAFVVSWN